MGKVLKYRIRPEIGLNEQKLDQFLKSKWSKSGVPPTYLLKKRSIDARKSKPMVEIEVELFENGEPFPKPTYQKPDQLKEGQNELIIIGSGPAGLFAALKCLEMGVKPIILERGNDVRARRRDLANICLLYTSPSPRD